MTAGGGGQAAGAEAGRFEKRRRRPACQGERVTRLPGPIRNRHTGHLVAHPPQIAWPCGREAQLRASLFRAWVASWQAPAAADQPCRGGAHFFRPREEHTCERACSAPSDRSAGLSWPEARAVLAPASPATACMLRDAHDLRQGLRLRSLRRAMRPRQASRRATRLSTRRRSSATSSGRPTSWALPTAPSTRAPRPSRSCMSRCRRLPSGAMPCSHAGP